MNVSLIWTNLKPANFKRNVDKTEITKIKSVLTLSPSSNQSFDRNGQKEVFASSEGSYKAVKCMNNSTSSATAVCFISCDQTTTVYLSLCLSIPRKFQCTPESTITAGWYF